MNDSSDHPDPDRAQPRAQDEDAPPRRGHVLLMAVLVPVVGAAGGAAGPLLRGVSSAGGPLLVVAAAVAFLVCFAVFSLGAIWLIDRVSLAVTRLRQGHDRRTHRER
ncbi:hypothetical protein ACGF5F_35290 [Streptomyces sp. NPDC047821]|uniref:hypothetical protein n=1 Tax=Streptomyces sp. NPDC047821 TaxID=3365488 RepID=UPI00371DA284